MQRGIRPGIRPRIRQRARGFSLVELMVAMTLSLILLGGVIAIFASSRTTYETNDRMARIQESGRFALDSMVRDLRATGYVGCSVAAPFSSTLNNNTTLLWDFSRAAQGFDGQGTGFLPALDTTLLTASGVNIVLTPGSDVLVVRIPRPGAPIVRVMQPTTVGTDPVIVDLAQQTVFSAGDILMISDCNARAVFQVTARAGNALSHDAAGTMPGNSTADLGYAYAGLTDSGGAEVLPMQTVIYYLGRRDTAPANAPPSLWRRVAGGASEELVEGVENLQLAFGETTGATVTYRTAGAVTNWANVVSVNIALLVRSQSEYGNDRDQGTYDLISPALGARVTTPNDRHLRQMFATAVSLRNSTL
jgi:type IV pilus assembly protein PilW